VKLLKVDCILEIFIACFRSIGSGKNRIFNNDN
jgi:hypothetical protein